MTGAHERASASRTPTALAIAGSDSGGGAGIQADLKAFARCGVHGATAITAITAQNTLGVDAIHHVPADTILAQVRAVLADIRIDAVKVGMLGDLAATRAVAQALEELPSGVPVVVDPVMVSESGSALLDPDAQLALIEQVLPRASVITPNLGEARVITGARRTHGRDTPEPNRAPVGQDRGSGELDVDEDAEARALALALLDFTGLAAVLTGGHRRHAVDLFVERDRPGVIEIAGEREGDGAAHGSGCTHSSLLAAQLALGRTALDAARFARAGAGEAVAHGLRDVGGGAGPVDVLDLRRLREGASRTSDDR